MWTDYALSSLSGKKTYSRDELYQVFSREKTDLNDTAFRWLLYSLLQENRIYKLDYDTYTIKKPDNTAVYQPLYSKKARDLIDSISAKYPTLNFVVFESAQLNEFLNHQIAQNTIYIQVDKELISYIFDEYRAESTGTILYKPTRKDYERYWTKDCIVFLDLVSQSPLLSGHPHAIMLEKMLVDIIAEKTIAATFSPSELPFVFENALHSYSVDTHKMNRYAGRRNKTEIINKYLKGIR